MSDPKLGLGKDLHHPQVAFAGSTGSLPPSMGIHISVIWCC